jgi:DNA-binding response OmpR family regulator
MPSQRTRILIVDDERFFRKAIRDALAGEGYEIELAATGAEALERLEGSPVVVMVLDVQLPDQSGLDVLRHVQEQQPEVRVVVLSAHTDQEYVLEALRLGACDYLAKPLHEEELRLSVRRAVEAHAVASGWQALQGRVGMLALELERLVSQTDGQDQAGVAGLAVEVAARVLQAAKTSVMLLDPTGRELRVAAAFGRKLAPERFDSVSLGEGVAGWVVARGESVWVQDVAADPRFAARPRRYDTHSFVVVPLQQGPRTGGALCATDRLNRSSFTEADAALLRLLALAIGPRLDPEAGAGRVGDLRGAEVEPQSLDGDVELARRVCDVLTREVEPERLLSGALRVVAERLEAAPVSLYLLDATGGELLREAQWEGAGVSDRPWLSRGRGLTGTVVETGLPVATASPADDPRFDAQVDTPEGGAPAALLVVPMRFRGTTLGCLRAFPKDGATASPRTAEVLGAVLSAAVRNVVLYRSLIDSIEEVARIRREGQA